MRQGESAGFQRKMGHTLETFEQPLVEDRLLGRFEIKDEATMAEFKKLDKELANAVPDPGIATIEGKSVDELLKRGYELVEGKSQEASQTERPPDMLKDIRQQLIGPLDLDPEKARDQLNVFSLRNTPLHSRLGFVGVVKVKNESGTVYVPFEYAGDKNRPSGLTNVYIRKLLDPQVDKEAYAAEIKNITLHMAKEIRRLKLKRRLGPVAYKGIRHK